MSHNWKFICKVDDEGRWIYAKWDCQKCGATESQVDKIYDLEDGPPPHCYVNTIDDSNSKFITCQYICEEYSVLKMHTT